MTIRPAWAAYTVEDDRRALHVGRMIASGDGTLLGTPEENLRRWSRRDADWGGTHEHGVGAVP